MSDPRAAAALGQYLDRHWQWTLDEHPEFSIQTGEARPRRPWTDWSAAGITRRRAAEQGFLADLDRIGPDSLDGPDRLNYDLARRQAASAVEAQRYPSELLPLDQLNGVHQRIAMSLEEMPPEAAWRSERLHAGAGLIRQSVALMREGVAQGIVPPRLTLADVDGQLADLAGGLLAPIAPAVGELRQFVADEYLPACRESIGLSELPGGEEWYAFRVREETTTALGPDEIHAIGRDELPRIHAEMDDVLAAVGWRDGRTAFMAHLRSDPRYFFDTPDDLVTAYRALCKRIDPALAGLFGTLPRLPYGVEPMPAYLERSGPAAYYLPGSPAAARPGTFAVNAFGLPSRPRWSMVPLALHEAVPGHHLQFAVAQELEDVPAFRRHGSWTAFVEGWALYAESLGHEMGLYDEDPYARFGALVFDAWRSCRLVVDTGIHSRGWTRDAAVEFVLANAGLTRHDAQAEVDRYIAWPAQALSYKIGQRQISALRRGAEETQGDAFDLRAFHDQILGQGPLPLDILAAQFESGAEWRGAGAGE